MAAASLFARSLLAACFALLVAACDDNNCDVKSPNCKELVTGNATSDVIILDQTKTTPYQTTSKIDLTDHCSMNNKTLAGALVVACDPLGPAAPSVQPLSTLSHSLECNTDGPCPAGLVVFVSQYCAAI